MSATKKAGCTARVAKRPQLVCFEVRSPEDLVKMKKLQKLWAEYQEKKAK